MRGCHGAALFNGVVEQSQSCGRAVGAALLEPYLLEYVRHGVADCGRWREGEIDYAERHVEPARGFARDELAETGYLERGFLYRVGNVGEVAVRNLLECAADNAGTRYADIYHALRLAGAVECARHERVILGGVAEYDELRRSDAVVVGCELGCFSDDFAHERHSVHVYAGLCRADIDARANVLGAREGFGYAFDKRLVAGGEALLNERGVAADEVDSDGLRRLFERERVFYGVAAGRSRKHGDGGDGDAFVDYRHAVFLFDLAADSDKLFRLARYLVIDSAAGVVDILRAAVEQGYAHGDCAYI